MFRPRVIPCLLLKGDGLVKTIGFDNPRYLGDPINAVRIFNEKEADELIFLNIEASRPRRGLFGRLSRTGIPLDVVGRISRECMMPLTYGGGVRSVDDIRALFGVGVEKVALNTAAVENPGLVTEACDAFGSQSIIASIDARRRPGGEYEVFTHGGTNGTGMDPVSLAVELEARGAGEIIITSVEHDGTMQGYDLELTRRVADSVGIPVIACGGAGSLADLRAGYDDGNASALAAGSLFVYHGRKRAVLISYPSRSELRAVFGGA